ncbi:ArsR/SmtB family transcription factor [Maricaulis sp.]|uniref:ArsR/SmtB family transcription factor n=1 Tax=Maricaulis sp. TaxID=1486257 RepID=UPI003A8F948A
MPNYSNDLDNTFRALADPTRRAVIARLIQGPASVSELAKPFEMAMPSLMQHLRVLEDGGLIRSTKQGRVRTCQIEPLQLQRAQDWIARQRAQWEGRLDRLEDYLETTRKDGDTP